MAQRTPANFQFPSGGLYLSPKRLQIQESDYLGALRIQSFHTSEQVEKLISFLKDNSSRHKNCEYVIIRDSKAIQSLHQITPCLTSIRDLCIDNPYFMSFEDAARLRKMRTLIIRRTSSSIDLSPLAKCRQLWALSVRLDDVDAKTLTSVLSKDNIGLMWLHGHSSSKTLDLRSPSLFNLVLEVTSKCQIRIHNLRTLKLEPAHVAAVELDKTYSLDFNGTDEMLKHVVVNKPKSVQTISIKTVASSNLFQLIGRFQKLDRLWVENIQAKRLRWEPLAKLSPKTIVVLPENALALDVSRKISLLVEGRDFRYQNGKQIKEINQLPELLLKSMEKVKKSLKKLEVDQGK